jgi:hypothetical protein
VGAKPSGASLKQSRPGAGRGSLLLTRGRQVTRRVVPEWLYGIQRIGTASPVGSVASDLADDEILSVQTCPT